MAALIVLAVTFVLLWLLFIRPQQRRVRAHNQLITELQEGDEVILSSGIYGRITELGSEDMTLEVAPDIELRVARQAVLRPVEPEADEGARFDVEAAEDDDSEPDQEPASRDGLPAPTDPT